MTHFGLFLLHKKADESKSTVGHQLFQLIVVKYSPSNDSHQRVRDQVIRDAVGSAWLFSTERFIKTSLAFLAVGGERIELSYLSV